jgi:hypothetical protein
VTKTSGAYGMNAHRTTTVQDAVSAISTVLVRTASCKARKASQMDAQMKRIISSSGIRSKTLDKQFCLWYNKNRQTFGIAAECQSMQN